MWLILSVTAFALLVFGLFLYCLLKIDENRCKKHLGQVRKELKEYNEALAKEICEMMGLEWDENHDFTNDTDPAVLFRELMEG